MKAIMTKNITYKPIVLCILDGWGDGNYNSSNQRFNAPKQASTPNFDYLLSSCPNSHLKTHAEFVGLPSGQMGNSEVGHTNIGAGRIVMQTLPLINHSIERQDYLKTKAFVDFTTELKQNKCTAHLIAIMSNGGVHGHLDHLIDYTKTILQLGIDVSLHLITDGRDVEPKCALKHLSNLKDLFVLNKSTSRLKIATITGRYWAMDRDNNWERTELAANAIINAQSTSRATCAIDAIKDAYDLNLTDEFIKPTIIGDYNGIKQGDGVFCLNFRADRMRQLLDAVCNPDFKKFALSKTKISNSLGLISYSALHNNYIKVLYEKQILKNTLGEVLQSAKIKQLRAAETEKYPHVTYFFNGGRELPFDLEQRILTPSPKVATYDKKPEMSANALLDAVIKKITNEHMGLTILNFANPDMVGHTGKLSAAIKACEVVDKCLGELMVAVDKIGGVLFITADHGNCEIMFDSVNNCPHTSHTLNPVNFIVYGLENIDLDARLNDGILADIAPSILYCLNVDKPSEMTGRNLLEKLT